MPAAGLSAAPRSPLDRRTNPESLRPESRVRRCCRAQQNQEDPKNFHPNVPQDPGVFQDFSFGADLAPVNGLPRGYVSKGLIDAAEWLTRALESEVDAGFLNEPEAMEIVTRLLRGNQEAVFDLAGKRANLVVEPADLVGRRAAHAKGVRFWPPDTHRCS